MESHIEKQNMTTTLFQSYKICIVVWIIIFTQNVIVIVSVVYFVTLLKGHMDKQRKTDTTVTNPVISPEAEDGHYTSILLQSYNNNNGYFKCYFSREHIAM